MSNEEKVIEVSLKMVQSGLTKGTWGNISLREGDLIWITPSGVEYTNLKVSDISIINLKTGEQISGLKPSSEYHLHKAIYEKCPDIAAVVHTHSLYATSFAIALRDIPCCTEDQAGIIGGNIECPTYVPAGTIKLGEVVSEKLHYGSKYASLIAYHGLVAVGRSLNEAYTVAEIAEKSAKAVYHAYALNPEIKSLPESDIKSIREKYIKSYSEHIVSG